jgi:hypothetical protein
MMEDHPKGNEHFDMTCTGRLALRDRGRGLSSLIARETGWVSRFHGSSEQLQICVRFESAVIQGTKPE